MDQIKIGKFIASCRKEKNLTQAQLAEKLGISIKMGNSKKYAGYRVDARIM